MTTPPIGAPVVDHTNPLSRPNTDIMPNMDAPDTAVCASELSHLGGAATPSRSQAAAVKLWLSGASEPAMPPAAGGCEEARGEEERVRGEGEPPVFFCIGAHKRS